jgi:PAS domain S-box-containing protein
MFQSLFEYSNNGIVITTPVDDGNNFIIKDINPEALKIEKLKKEDAIGKLITEIWPGIESFSLLTTMRNVCRTGKAEQHPTSFYQDERISGWRENFVYKAKTGEIVNIYYDRTEEKTVEIKNASIIKALPDLFFRFGQDGTYLDCWTSNPKLLIQPKDVFIGKKLEEVLPKEIAEGVYKLIREVIETKEPRSFEYELVLYGSKRYFESRLIFDFDHTVMAIVRDVTDKIEMVGKLTESEQKFKKIFKTSPDAILLTSVVDGKILDVNEAGIALTGYTLNEMLGKTTIEMEFWFDIEERSKYIQKLLTEKQITNYEAKFRTKHGIIDAIVSGEIMEINGQHYFVSIIRNITDLRKMNRELKFNQEKFRDIVENISEIVMEMDKNFIITFANKGVYNITEFMAEELIGTQIQSYFTEESIEKCDKVHSDSLRKKDTSIHSTICDFITKSGKIRILNIQWRIAFMNGSGTKTYMVARDVTDEEMKKREKKAVEDKLKDEFQKALSRIGADLKNMTSRGEK